MLCYQWHTLPFFRLTFRVASLAGMGLIGQLFPGTPSRFLWRDLLSSVYPAGPSISTDPELLWILGETQSYMKTHSRSIGLNGCSTIAPEKHAHHRGNSGNRNGTGNSGDRNGTSYYSCNTNLSAARNKLLAGASDAWVANF
jgi:hypothetical protein